MVVEVGGKVRAKFGARVRIYFGEKIGEEVWSRFRRNVGVRDAEYAKVRFYIWVSVEAK